MLSITKGKYEILLILFSARSFTVFNLNSTILLFNYFSVRDVGLDKGMLWPFSGPWPGQAGFGAEF